MRVNLNLALVTASLLATGAIIFVMVRQGKNIAQAAGTVANAVNPINPDNIFAKGANAVVQTVTGDATATVGSKIADLFDTSGAAAVAPSVPARGKVVNIQDYFSTLERDDAEAVPPPGWDSTDFATTAGGAATGRIIARRVSAAGG